MGFESNTGLGVNNHYGARNVGGFGGAEAPSAGAEKEISVNFDGDATGVLVQVPAGAIVTEIVDFFTGSISAATVGAQDISAANGAVANYVTVSTTADLTITGPTAGTAVVKYLYVV
jgi:hypothetical protein